VNGELSSGVWSTLGSRKTERTEEEEGKPIGRHLEMAAYPCMAYVVSSVSAGYTL